MADYETLATTAIKNIIAKTKLIRSFINEKDKEPSWDGNLYLYKKENVKAGIKKIPVQIKGENIAHKNRDKCSHSFLKNDLQNYYDDGGVLYLVVRFDALDKPKVYYNSLLPVKLKSILATIKGNSKSLICKELPIHEDELVCLLGNFCLQREKQYSLTKEHLVDINSVLKNKAQLSFITFTKPRNLYEIENLFFKNDLYFYLNKDGIDIPVEYITITESRKTIDCKVTIDNVLIYDKATIINDGINKSILIGKSIKIPLINNTKNKIEYVLQGNLYERIRDLNFLIKLIEKGSFEINGQSVGDTRRINKSKLESLKNLLLKYKKVDNALKELKITQPLNMDSFSKQNWEHLDIFMNAFIMKKSIFIEGAENDSYRVIHLGNIDILVSLKKLDDGKYVLYNYNDLNFSFGIKTKDGLLKIPNECAICNFDWLKYDNVKIDNYIESLKSTPAHPELFDIINQSLLKIIDAYDSRLDNKLLSIAQGVNNWLLENDTNETNVHIINALQIKKRKDILSPQDKITLYEIMQNEKENKIALYCCAILLDDYQELSKISNQLNSNELKEIEKFPIQKLKHKTN